MTWWKLIVGSIGLLFFVWLLWKSRKSWKKMIEWLSIFWFRVAAAFLVLFVIHLAAGFVGLFVPINIFSGLLVALLGIPGLASVLALAIIL